MMKTLLFLLILLFTGFSTTDTPGEPDAYWKEVSRTVAEGDYEGYAALYHADAVLVNGITGESYPIADALAGWKRGFDDTKAGKMEAGVEFRISRRLMDDTTAHDTGIFRYYAQPEGGEMQVAMVHFEGLLTKKDGRWLMMMEYQKSMATEAEWEALNK
jgi:uncharacterized protein (TIGR02246 family)